LEEKVGLYVRIDRKLRDKLYALIRSKYPESTYGGLSAEVQEAIVSWLASHEHTTLHTKSLNPRLPRTHRICQEIMEAVKSTGHQTQVSRKILLSAITSLRGSDERTVDKWLQTLLREGYIKILNYNVFEIL
jgi:hypothetical protein